MPEHFPCWTRLGCAPTARRDSAQLQSHVLDNSTPINLETYSDTVLVSSCIPKRGIDGNTCPSRPTRNDFHPQPSSLTVQNWKNCPAKHRQNTATLKYQHSGKENPNTVTISRKFFCDDLLAGRRRWSFTDDGPSSSSLGAPPSLRTPCTNSQQRRTTPPRLGHVEHAPTIIHMKMLRRIFIPPPSFIPHHSIIPSPTFTIPSQCFTTFDVVLDFPYTSKKKSVQHPLQHYLPNF